MKPKQYLALRNSLIELVGTTAIVYFTNWSYIVYKEENTGVSMYALVFGLIYSLTTIIGGIASGGIFDPAVSISYLLYNKLDFSQAIPYISMQLLGSFFAALLLKFQMPAPLFQKMQLIGPLGVPKPDADYFYQSMLTETIAVFVIHIIRLSTIVDNRGHKVHIIDC